MGEPYFKVKNVIKKNNVKVFSSNYALYGDMSQRVMEILLGFSPDVEIYSIDEAFLSLKGFKNHDLLTYCKHIEKQSNSGPVFLLVLVSVRLKHFQK